MLRPPFTALNIAQLSAKACKGIYPALSATYSKTMGTIIKKMLQVLPSQRPTSFELLEMKELEVNLTKTCAKLSPHNSSKDLLATIMMPRKLNDLANRLPRPKYAGMRIGRMNSQPARLPSGERSRSRAGSALSRKRWEVEKKLPEKEEPQSVLNSKKQQEDYHLIKETRSSRRYYSKENVDRGVYQRAASNMIPNVNVNSNSRVINFSRRSNSNNSRLSEEQKVPAYHVPLKSKAQNEGRKWGMPPTGMKPPLANVNMNVPNPRISRPYDDPPVYNRPPTGKIGQSYQPKPGLPPIGLKPGFGGMNNGQRNVSENINVGRVCYPRSNSPFRYK
jgi:hypothetical protein